MLNSKLFILLIILSGLFLNVSFADIEHHKNTLIGGRAATLGGSFNAISDDASGAYYNPAGLNFSSGNSVSGSANTYSITKTKYHEAIGNRDWDRNSSNLMPNFFGVVQKVKGGTFAFSYAVTDSMVEHQDQIYENVTEVDNPMSVYALNIHSEDNTYHLGPSYSKKINDQFSFGATLYYHYRVYRRAQSQLLRFTDGSDESSYLNTTKKERGLNPKLGLMWTPKEKWSVGATLGHTFLLSALTDNQQNKKAKGASTYTFGQNAETTKRKTPIDISGGVAYFPSPYLLFTSDIDYYFQNDGSKRDVVNLSFGSEYFINEGNAIRGGLFTNRSNSKKPSSNTVAPLERINLYGVSAGYTIYTKATALTFGTIYQRGKGLAQIYTGSSALKHYDTNNFNFIIAADYGF